MDLQLLLSLGWDFVQLVFYGTVLFWALAALKHAARPEAEDIAPAPAPNPFYPHPHWVSDPTLD